MNPILVTGGAGFLGSHLCDRLLADGHAVVCLDSFLTGQEANIEALHTHPRFALLRQDVAQPMALPVHQIFNLACAASPPQYQRDPIHTTQTLVLGAMNVLELAQRHGARVLQASTSEVYGNPLVHPQHEGYWGHVNPIGPRACYDEGKRCAETLFFDYQRHRGVDVRVVRIFNTYGPRMRPDDGRVVSNFIVQALRGEPLTLYGDGLQTRSFCYVDDLIEGMVRMVRQDHEAGPVNLGNPGEFTIRELAEWVLRLTGSRSALAWRPLPADDPAQRRPDIAKAQSALGWTPQVSLEDGLKETIAYFRRVLR